MLCHKCSACRKEIQEKIEEFKNKYVDGGVVEKKDECRTCDNVEGDDLNRCVVCGEPITKD